ncbi:MAG: glycine zipper 2TM domain-containing protein [Rhodanobacteraceae bacterium]|nr:MAG: glycine zipper 2TM domain-containing protein [Rhodanobacteraceae bacterium]
MSKEPSTSIRKPVHVAIPMVSGAIAALLLAGCAPAYNARPGTYYGAQSGGYSNRVNCYQGCGVVRDIRQTRVGSDSSTALGTVIGAVAGGLIGHQIGGGKGKTAATVAGAVGGGFAGHAIGERAGSGDGWQVVVQLDNGQYATVTQRRTPQVRIGERVIIRDNQVYRY